MDVSGEDIRSKLQATTLGSPIMDSFAMLDGLIYCAGTVIPVLTRFGVGSSVRNLKTGEVVPLDAQGSIKLQKGDILEVVEAQSQERPRRMSYGQLSVQDFKKYMGSRKRTTSSNPTGSRNYSTFNGAKGSSRKFSTGVKTLQSLFGRGYGNNNDVGSVDLDTESNSSSINILNSGSAKSTPTVRYTTELFSLHD